MLLSRPLPDAAAVLLLLLLAAPAAAERTRPQAVPLPPAVPAAVDAPYPGTIALDIDATDLARGVFRVRETVPVAQGARELILQLPEWIPGHHSPSGTISQLADLHFSAAGQPLAWRRDPVEMFAFHVAVPAGTAAVTASFVHTAPLQPGEGRVTMTADMLNLQWDRMSLYPAGHYARQIRIAPAATFPAGWSVFTALDGQQANGERVRWAETDYETLIDSPVFAGAHAKRVPMNHGATLDLVADKPELLAIRPEHAAAFAALADEALLAFGARHFDHYDLLVALTDKLGGIGLEHHRSSENSLAPKALISWEEFDWGRNVVAHEFAHSWVGKYRRPARLWTPDYRQPMQGDLLWAYEGQNQFWGYVLAARSGLQSKAAVLGMFASNAGQFTQWPGRGWRSVEDTGFDPVTSGRRPKPYPSLERNEDYYTEGALIWLEADQIIRDGTAGARSIDDFARAFFGMRDGDYGELPFELPDVVAALNGVFAYDWEAFLRTRLNQPGQPAPLGGIERGGYRLVWKDTPNPFDKARFAEAKVLNLTHSLGMVLDREGKVTSTRWDSPAFDAGLVSGAKVLAVNGFAYDADTLKAAITAAKGTAQPIALIVQRGDRVLPLAIAYHDGLRYPWLERVAPGTAPAGIDRLLAPRRAGASGH